VARQDTTIVQQTPTAPATTELDPRSLTGNRYAGWSDSVFKWASVAFGLVTVVLILWIAYGLYRESALAREMFGWRMLHEVRWDVQHQIFGALPFIFGTAVTSIVALALSIPLGIGAALFLTEIAPRWIATPVSFTIELIAAVPSVIFGLWGFQVLCPFLRDHLNPWLVDRFGALPIFAGPAYVSNMLAAGIILAVMVLPLITSVSREVIRTVPASQREAALGLGATKWETVRSVVLRGAKSGIFGAVILALGRAIGETMAVVMVIGNNPQISRSLLQPGYTMPSLLANEFNEAANDPVQRSALLEIAFLLFGITLVVNIIARLIILWSTQSGSGAWQSTPRAQVIREWSGKLFARGLAAGTALVLALQVISDVRSHGFAGLLGPIEILALVYAATRVITVVARKKNVSWNRWRKTNHAIMYGVFSTCAAVACFMLALLLFYVTMQGLRSLNVNFFLNDGSKPPDDPTGGMKNGIIGTLMLVGIASGIGIPIGVMGGIFVSEFRGMRLSGFVRFAADVLNGIPSVVIGMFAYTAFVLPFGHFSAWAGGAALGIMMIPTIVRTTEEMLRMVPASLREGSLALGANRFRTVRSVVLPAARAGIVTGIMLAVARVAGETAPLLFTAFGNPFVNTNPGQPTHSMTMMIYRYATSAYTIWVDIAWAGAFVLLVMVLIISILARVATRNRYAMR
jgi:phosphate transport system permease protein